MSECQIVYFSKNLLAQSTVFFLVEKSEGGKQSVNKSCSCARQKGKKEMQRQTYPSSA